MAPIGNKCWSFAHMRANSPSCYRGINLETIQRGQWTDSILTRVTECRIWPLSYFIFLHMELSFCLRVCALSLFTVELAGVRAGGKEGGMYNHSRNFP